MIIYQATNLINGKSYIGQTIRNLKVRISEHSRSKKSLLGKAISKYGINSFEFKVIYETDDFDTLQTMERKFIKEFNTLVPEGYNLVEGGGGTKGYSHSTHSRKLMAQKKKGKYLGANNPFYGKQHSEETKLKMEKPKNLSDEAKQKIREAHPTVAVKNITTGEIFERVKDAAEKYSVAPTNITRACRNPQRSVRGCKWSYL